MYIGVHRPPSHSSGTAYSWKCRDMWCRACRGEDISLFLGMQSRSFHLERLHNRDTSIYEANSGAVKSYRRVLSRYRSSFHRVLIRRDPNDSICKSTHGIRANACPSSPRVPRIPLVGRRSQRERRTTKSAYFGSRELREDDNMQDSGKLCGPRWSRLVSHTY